MRRRDRAAELLEAAEPWDLVVLDEAHHARRRAPGSKQERGPNTLLRLMRRLKDRTQGLVLLTATPMQVHPVEVWDLLDLLGLPPEWTPGAFLDFFEHIERPSPSAEAMERMASLFRSAERAYGEIGAEDARRLTGLSPLKSNKVLRALRDAASIPRRQLETDERRAAAAVMRAGAPVRRLVSRNTRELLRRYFRTGMMTTPIAERRVEDRFLEMTGEERAIYEAVEACIAITYDKARADERTAVGFVLTVYRRRLASSFAALSATLQKRSHALSGSHPSRSMDQGFTATDHAADDDLPDDETADDIPDSEEMETLAQQALAVEERREIERLLSQTRNLPPDSKLESLETVLAELGHDGYPQVMVFTQYTDTMDFLRDSLGSDPHRKLMCHSGRGGEVMDSAGGWRTIGRDDARRRFREGGADILLCTDAAAEGLNFQFCGAVVNYDMPWNPMRVEQRIGRIDRLGQKYAIIRIVNLHYEGTVEADIYRALRERIGLFETFVGRLQPILACLPGAITKSVLSGEGRDAPGRASLVDAIEREARETGAAGFDIDAVTEDDRALPERPQSTVTMDDLDRVAASSTLMPPGVEIRPMGRREYNLLASGMGAPLRVTTDPAYFEEHAESLELWSPGNPLFTAPEFADSADPEPPQGTLKEILDRG